MADFVYMTKFREYKIDHVIKTKDSDFFKVVTGISKDDFTELCDKGFIHRDSLNRMLENFVTKKKALLSRKNIYYPT